jgi:hypothetical protein
MDTRSEHQPGRHAVRRSMDASTRPHPGHPDAHGLLLGESAEPVPLPDGVPAVAATDASTPA